MAVIHPWIREPLRLPLWKYHYALQAKVFQAKDIAILRKIHTVFLLPNFGQDVCEMSIHTQARMG